MIESQQIASAPFTSREFRTAMGQFASGVVVITGESDTGAHAMTANAFMSGSLEPPLIVISVATTARMHELLAKAETFGVSILTSSQEKTSNHFAGRRSEGFTPAFEMLDGIPTIAGAGVRLAANKVHSYPCGDHTLYVGHVRALALQPDPRPLLYHCGRYGAVSPSEWHANAARLWPEIDGHAW